MYLLLLSWVVFLLVRLTVCNSQIPDALLTGSSVTSIPTGMEPTNMSHLKIFNTNYQTLDLRQLLPYPSLHYLEVDTSPVTKVVSTFLPTLAYLHLNSLNMIVPPPLGYLDRQLVGLAFSKSNLTSIPDDYFSHFSQLKGIGLENLGLTSLRETWFRGLNQLQKIYISANPLGSLPPLQLWNPKIKRVYARNIGLLTIPVKLIKGMKSPGVLELTDNHIFGVPGRNDFEPIAKWQVINLKGNPLHCDEGLCWIQVNGKCHNIKLHSLLISQATVNTIINWTKNNCENNLIEGWFDPVNIVLMSGKHDIICFTCPNKWYASALQFGVHAMGEGCEN